MEFKRYLGIIDRALEKALPRASEAPGVVHKAMRYSVLSGGKRIRPIIVIESARACGRGGPDAVAAACAIELVHTYSLIHDDLPSMDNDDFRRGKPTCHKAFGEAVAILAGDALLTLAFNVIACHMKPAPAVAAAAELSEAAGSAGMVGGQAADIEFQRRKKDAATLEYINRLKTGRLFEASARLGGIAAGASARRIGALGRYGLRLGMAFQIVDDILDGDGYEELPEAAKARRAAEKIIEDAKKVLRPFGRRADGLRHIADNVLHRIR